MVINIIPDVHMHERKAAPALKASRWTDWRFTVAPTLCSRTSQTASVLLLCFCAHCNLTRFSASNCKFALEVYLFQLEHRSSALSVKTGDLFLFVFR